MTPPMDISLAVGSRAVANRQINQTQVELGRGESFSNRTPLAAALLLEHLNRPLRIAVGNAVNLRPGIVGRVAFDEDDFRAQPHMRRASDGLFDVTGFVASRDDY